MCMMCSREAGSDREPCGLFTASATKSNQVERSQAKLCGAVTMMALSGQSFSTTVGGICSLGIVRM